MAIFSHLKMYALTLFPALLDLVVHFSAGVNDCLIHVCSCEATYKP